MGNPFTHLRQVLGRIRAEADEMYQDTLQKELAWHGAPPAAAEHLEVTSPAPARLAVQLAQAKEALPAAEAVTPKRRGRPPKTPSPPLRPQALEQTACPTPDWDVGVASPASPEPRGSPPQGNKRGTGQKNFPWADASNPEICSIGSTSRRKSTT